MKKKKDKCEILAVLWFIAASVCTDHWSRLGASVATLAYFLSSLFDEEGA